MLTSPIKCTRPDAWLGEAWYFWKDEKYAHHWGKCSKRDNYNIYKCTLDDSDFLDTVYNEEHYNHFIKSLEKVSNKIKELKNSNKSPQLHDLYSYIIYHGLWKDISGIVFADYPTHSLHAPIFRGKMTHVHIPFYKRIQYAVYDEKVISNFHCIC